MTCVRLFRHYLFLHCLPVTRLTLVARCASQNNYHRNLPSLQYFATAMAYYRAMYKKVVFIVATDEPKFALRSVPNKFGDVYYTSE